LDGIGGKTGTAGSTSGVTALGSGGSIVVDMGECAIIDGKGKDFVVFENAFFITSAKVPASSLPQAAIYDPDSVYVFSEAGRVGVSEDGVVFKDFPCDFGIAANGSYGARLASGCAGITPTIFGGDPFKAGLKNGAGGDAFDLADIGVKKARYVRIVSAGVFKPLPAGEKPGNGAAGFDLDAVAVINGEK
jgi:hypothetical protein